MKIYDRIKELCKEKGITITGLEKDLGFARGSLSKIDKNRPRIDRIQKLAKYFDKPVNYFTSDPVQFIGHQKEYYENAETARLAQEMFEDKDMRMLFDMKKNMTPERFARQMQTFRDMYRLEHPEEFPEDWTD